MGREHAWVESEGERFCRFWSVCVLRFLSSVAMKSAAKPKRVSLLRLQALQKQARLEAGASKYKMAEEELARLQAKARPDTDLKKQLEETGRRILPSASRPGNGAWYVLQACNMPVCHGQDDRDDQREDADLFREVKRLLSTARLDNYFETVAGIVKLFWLTLNCWKRIAEKQDPRIYLRTVTYQA